MKTTISKYLRRIANTIAPADPVAVDGEYLIRVWRADGRHNGGFNLIDEKLLKNVVTRAGLNRMANKWVSNAANSAMAYTVIGTQTATHSLDSVQAGVGEVIRKIAATVTNSREWAYLQNTYGGASDTLTGVALDTVGVSDFASSHASTGILGSAVNGLGVTLQGSDLLDVTYRARVGSHNLTHST